MSLHLARSTVVVSPSRHEAEFMLDRLGNQPFDAGMVAAAHAIFGFTFPVSDGIWTPPPSIGGAVPSADPEPGVAAPGSGLVTSP